MIHKATSTLFSTKLTALFSTKLTALNFYVWKTVCQQRKKRISAFQDFQLIVICVPLNVQDGDEKKKKTPFAGVDMYLCDLI